MFVSILVFTFFISFFSRKLFLSGDIETNSGPRCNLNNHFTISCWNLNSTFSHIFFKVQLLNAYLAVRKFDMIYFSETYLNSGFSCNDDNLDIPCYIIVRVYHPANNKSGGVYMYYKKCLPLKLLDMKFLRKKAQLAI